MKNIKNALFLFIAALLTFTFTNVHVSAGSAPASLCTGVILNPPKGGEKCPDTAECDLEHGGSGKGDCNYYAKTNDKGEITEDGCRCVGSGTMANDNTSEEEQMIGSIFQF